MNPLLIAANLVCFIVPLTPHPRDSTMNEAVQATYIENMREFHAARYQAYLANTDLDDLQNPRQQELSRNAVKVDRKTGWPTLSNEVRAAAALYYERVEAEDWGSVAVYRVPTAQGDTLAVRVSTDGDDGWLEVYDMQGKLLGAGRTYIELIAWLPQEEVRQFHTPLPAALDTSKTLWRP